MVSRYHPEDTERSGSPRVGPTGAINDERSTPSCIPSVVADFPPLESLSEAMAAFDAACRHLFYAMDATLDMPTYRFPTNVLLKIDHCRELAAALDSSIAVPTSQEQRAFAAAMRRVDEQLPDLPEQAAVTRHEDGSVTIEALIVPDPL